MKKTNHVWHRILTALLTLCLLVQYVPAGTGVRAADSDEYDPSGDNTNSSGTGSVYQFTKDLTDLGWRRTYDTAGGISSPEQGAVPAGIPPT